MGKKGDTSINRERHQGRIARPLTQAERIANLRFVHKFSCTALNRFKCPDVDFASNYNVLLGEYDIRGLTLLNPTLTIVDIGANHGAFTVWAAQRFAGASFFCYEPNPACFPYFKENINEAGLTQQVTHSPTAVYPTDTETVLFYPGKTISGESSLYAGSRTVKAGIAVGVTHPKNLPSCEILKIDTEGAEVPILRAYLPRTRPGIVLLEYHSEEDRRIFDVLLPDYILADGSVTAPNVGVHCYVRRDLAKTATGVPNDRT